jgi:hypothetical protein
MTQDKFKELLASGSDEALVDAIWDFLPEHESEDGHFDGDVIRVTQYASAEICNGGFHQFYSNGIFNPRRLIECFEELNVPILANCVRESMLKFPNGEPPVRRPDDHEPIDEKLDQMGITFQSFEDIERTYYSHVDDLYNSWGPYIRRNPELYSSYLAAE